MSKSTAALCINFEKLMVFYGIFLYLNITIFLMKLTFWKLVFFFNTTTNLSVFETRKYQSFILLLNECMGCSVILNSCCWQQCHEESGRNLGQFLYFSTFLLKISLTIFLETFSLLVCAQLVKRRSGVTNSKSCSIVL